MHAAVTTQGITPEVISLNDDWEAWIFRDWNLPEEITGRWKALALLRGDDGLFLQPEWFQAWCNSFQPDELLLTAIVSHEEIRGLFPCCKRKTDDGNVALASMGTDGYFDFLVDPIRPEQILAKFVELLAKLRLASPMRFNSFLDTSYCTVFRNCLRTSGFPYWNLEQRFAPYVDLRAQSWEDYEAGLHPKLRNNLKKGRRRAEREGCLSFEFVSDSKSIDSVMAEAIRVEGEGWKGEEGTAIRCSAEKNAWYKNLAHWAANQGRMRLFTFRLNGQMVAFDFCIAGDETLYAVKTGYDQNVAARFSPGNLMRHELLRRLFQDSNFGRYDFMGDCNPWKWEWTNLTRRCTWVRVYPRSARGWGQYLARHAWKEPLKRSEAITKLAGRLGLAKSLKP